MKKLLGIVVLIFSIMGFSVICHAEDGLQVYYSFDTGSVTEKDEVYTIKDLSGNGYNATSTESSIPILEGFDVIDSICGSGKAVCGAVKLPNAAFENINTSYTINFIGKYMVLDRTQKMLVLGDNYYSTPWGSGMCRLSTYHENSERWVEYRCNLPSHNKINMFTFICNEGTLDMYFNGKKVDKRYDNGVSSVILSELAKDTINEFIVQNKYLDEFRLYNRALTENEIQTLYTSVDLTPEPTTEPIPTPTIEPTIVPTTEPTGLLLHYSFDADSVTKKDGASYTIKDFSGNDFDATSYTKPKIVADFIPVLETVQAVKNECIDLAKTSGSVYLPKEAFVGVEDFTMSFWYTDEAVQVFTAQSVGTEKNITIRGMEGSGIQRYMSYCEASSHVFSMVPVGILSKELFSSMHMYTIVRSDGNIKMYFNGEEVEPQYSTDGISNVTFAEIASGDNVGIYFDNGYIDEFRFYNKTLTDEEIKLIYDSEKPIPTPTPVPTIEPTIIPTETPMVTVEPTTVPTVAPTIIPTITPTDEPKTEISLSIDGITDDGIMNCTIHNNTSEDISSKCILAVYNSNGELKGIKIIDGIPKGDTASELENCRDISMVKVFLWDSLTGMKPQFNSVKYQIV